MSLATIDLVIIGAFLTLVTVMGVALSRLASQGIGNYFLGGRKIPWWLLGGSTATSNFDMAGTMIIVAVVFSLGYKGFLVEFRGGVGLSLALLVVFLGKWLRRSRVMTPAEWMRLRFGTDKQGRTAHAVSAGANLILSVGMIVYFAAGAGAFLAAYLPFNELTCASILVAVGLAYTLLSGLYGVVFTDIVQMAIMIFGALFITVEAFMMVPGLELPDGFLNLSLESVPVGGELGAGLLALDAERWEMIFQFFGLFVFMWFMRSVLEGMGGVGGYTDQRFFAARNEREGSLIAFQAMVLSFFRWTMVAGLVVMGYAVVAGGGDGAAMISANPERVLPVVIGEMLPAGVRGLVLAGLVAAALSTFDSTLNAGASYVVRDIYQTYLRPEASQKQLIVGGAGHARRGGAARLREIQRHARGRVLAAVSDWSADHGDGVRVSRLADLQPLFGHRHGVRGGAVFPVVPQPSLGGRVQGGGGRVRGGGGRGRRPRGRAAILRCRP